MIVNNRQAYILTTGQNNLYGIGLTDTKVNVGDTKWRGCIDVTRAIICTSGHFGVQSAVPTPYDAFLSNVDVNAGRLILTSLKY